MAVNKGCFLKIKNLFREKVIIFLALFLTMSLSFLASILYNAKSDFYTLRTLAKQTLLFSPLIFFVTFFLVYRKKEKINLFLNKRVFPSIKNLFSRKSGIIAFILAIVAFSLLLLLVIPSATNYKRPIFKYEISIKPVDSETGDICIAEINNSAGSLLLYNYTAKNYQESGDWERNVNNCGLYLEKGKQGEITFDNIGVINDKFTIKLLRGQDQGEIRISSSFGKTRDIELNAESYELLNVDFDLGYFFFSNIVDAGFVLGIISALILLFISFPSLSFSKITGIFSSQKNKEDHSFRALLNKFWQFLDQKSTAIVVLFLLYAAGVLFTCLVINPMAYGPSHLGDELRYWNTALSLSNGTFKAVDYYRYPPVYPLSLLPAFLLSDPIKTYKIAKILNALYLTSAIIPGYLILRKFVKRNVALVAAALLLLNPVQLVMPGRILSESVFYPLFMWSVLFSFTNVFQASKRNRIIESLLLGVLIGALFLTRYIALVLIPAFLLIWWLRPFEDEKPPFLISMKKILHLILILLPMLVMIGVWVKVGVDEGLRVKDMIGLFIGEEPNPKQLTLGRLVMWTIFYGSYMILLAAPYITILLASLSEFKLKKWNEDTNRWMISLGVIIFVLMVACIRHSWRISYNYPFPQKLQGRYILYFGPLFLISSIIAISKTIKKTYPIQTFLYSSFLIVISYSFIDIGLIYFERPMSIAMSSPDGEFMRLIGVGFVFYLLIKALLDSTLLRSGKRKQLIVLISFLICFYVYGNVKMVNNMSKAINQIDNSQIYNLIFLNDDLSNEISGDEQTHLEIIYSDNISSNEVANWTNTLNFYRIADFSINELEKDSNVIYWQNVNIGLDEIPLQGEGSHITNQAAANQNMSIDKSLQDEIGTVFQACYNDETITLRRLGKEEFLKSSNPKYSHGSNYFEYLETTDR